MLQDASSTNYAVVHKLQSLVSENNELRDDLHALQSQITDDFKHVSNAIEANASSDDTLVVMQLPRGFSSAFSSAEESDKNNGNLLYLSFDMRT